MNISIQSKMVSLRGFALIALGCGLVATAQAQLVSVTTLTGAGFSGGEQGYSVAISADGNTAVVGAPANNSNYGGAWVFRRSSGAWGGGSALSFGASSGNPQLGTAVAISADGSTIAVGGPADTNGGAGAGAFWIFTSSGGSAFAPQGNRWYSTSGGVQLGSSLALSSDGNTLIAGAPGAAAVYVYTRSSGTWSPGVTLSASGGGFGTSVALSGDGGTALVGAPSYSGTGGAWVFTGSGSPSGSGAKLDLGTPAISSGQQGMSVALSVDGQTAIVGGFNSSSKYGAAYVYTASGVAWTQQAQLADGVYGSSLASAAGASVALSGNGNVALVGGFADASGWGPASVWEFTRSSTTWSQRTILNSGTGIEPGFSVALSSDGNTALAGAPLGGTEGEVFAYGAPDLQISNVHNGTFTRGANGTYKIVVTNSGWAPTSNSQAVTVTEVIPQGLTYSSVSGSGWGCVSALVSGVPTLTCNHSAAVVAVGGTYPELDLTMSVASSAPTALPTTATVSGGGETNTDNDSSADLVTLPQLPDLAISLSHTGYLYQGRTGVACTITVSNVSSGTSTSGLVTVTNLIPAGLTNLSYAASQSGWSCSGASTLTCTRSDALSHGASYAAIAYTVDVSGSASPTITNTASVAGGGDVNTANNSFADFASVGSSANSMTVASAHVGNFKAGQTGTYYITVTNGEPTPTSGLVTVVDALPRGWAAVTMSGLGWSCNVGTKTCTRQDVLPAGLSYRIITVTLNVTGGTGSVTNNVSVSGGGVPPGSGTDPTTIN